MRNWNCSWLVLSIELMCASRLPMRNWNCLSFLQLSRRAPASRLPMRNWNQASWRDPHSPRQASRLPMRNWNLNVGTFRTSINASRLPMRNWNMPVMSFRLLSLLASRLPMRNWNFCFWIFCATLCGFQTTYEELKHVNTRSNCIIFDCFQTTYEELKLQNMGMAASLDRASQVPRKPNPFINKLVWSFQKNNICLDFDLFVTRDIMNINYALWSLCRNNYG